jgi:hypothetical protein
MNGESMFYATTRQSGDVPVAQEPIQSFNLCRYSWLTLTKNMKTRSLMKTLNA